MLRKREERRRKSIALSLMRDVQGTAAQKLAKFEKVRAAGGFAKEDPADLEEAEKMLREFAAMEKRVMREPNVRSRWAIAGAIASILAIVLVFAVSVRAQEPPRIGLTLRTVTAELRKQHNLPEDVKGALVTAVAAGSPAQEKGIVEGDVIVEVGGKPVDTTQAIGRIVVAAVPSGSVTLKVMNSKGERRDVTVPFPKKPAPILPGPK